MALDLADIQGNLLRGYRSANARHFALGIGNAQGGAAFVGDLVRATRAGARRSRQPSSGRPARSRPTG